MKDESECKNSTFKLQCTIFNISYDNLEKLFDQRLCRRNIRGKIEKDGTRLACLPNKIQIKEQTTIKMSMNLSLMAHLLGASFDLRFNEEKKRHEKEESIKLYHACSRNLLNFLFRTDDNEKSYRKLHM